MRKIDLIVIHCSATRVDRTLTALIWRRCIGDGDSTEQVITTISAKTGQHFSPVPSNASGHMQKDSMRRVSESAMKRSGLPGTPGRYTDAGTTCRPPPAGASIGATFPRLPGVRTPGSQSGSERRWGDRTGRVDQGVSLL